MRLSHINLFRLGLALAAMAFVLIPISNVSALGTSSPQVVGAETTSGLDNISVTTSESAELRDNQYDNINCRSWTALGQLCADFHLRSDSRRYSNSTVYIDKPAFPMSLSKFQLSLEVCANSTATETCQTTIGERQYATLTTIYEDPTCGIVLLGRAWKTTEGCYSERDKLYLPPSFIGKYIVVRGKAYVDDRLYQTVYSVPWKYAQ